MTTLTDTEFFNLLKQNSYVHIPFPLEKSAIAINEAVDAFLIFLKEPETIRSHIDFSIAPLHRRGEVGYRHRLASDHFYNDNKEFFHYHPAIWEKYEVFIQENPVVLAFLLKAKPIWQAAYLAVQKVLNTFESVFRGTYDRVFKTDCAHVVLRFLKYDWQTSGKYLAKPHFDAGSFSLAIAESCTGLRIGSCPEDLKTVEHKPDQAIFMLSSNFKKIIKNTDEFSAGWHDVIQMDETQVGKPFARWAIVAFIEAHGVEALPRTETHKWFTGTDAL